MILPTDRTMFQNAWVCDDLEAEMKKWSEQMKVGPWFVAEHDEGITDVLYRGQPAELSMRVGLAQAGDVQIELIQPTVDGPCAYRDTVKPGELKFHHMCCWTDDIDADIEYYASLGYEAANLAKAGDMRFAYFDTNPLMGCMIEVIERNPGAEMMFARIRELGNNWDGEDPYRTVDQLFG
jgi:methylmalonyl-CoA/ethylmalonyl-CoA epimerase